MAQGGRTQTRELTVSVIQINSSDHHKEDNVRKILDLTDVAGQRGSELVVLPETFTGSGLSDHETYRAIAEPIPGPTVSQLAQKAARYGMTVIGSLYEQGEDGVIYNSAPVLGPDGALMCIYRKTHLFDPIGRPDIPFMQESDKVAAGDRLTVVEINRRRIGIAICSDLRFPEVFLNYALQDVHLIAIPSAFLAPRIDHWEFLLRARATDNQFFVIGSGMVGALEGTPISFVGRSMVVDPWGVIVAQAPDRECCVTTVIDLDQVRQVRGWWPLNRQRRPNLYDQLYRHA